MSKLVLPLILLLVNPSKLSLALSKTVRTCTPSHFNTGDHHSNLMCKDFSPFAVVEDGSYFIVDAVDSSATKFVNCVCSDCTVEGDRRPCGDGNECYDSCITSNCVCDEANIGPDQIDWTGGDSADCVIGASKTIPGASGQCAVIPAATASVGAGVSLAPCTSAISEVWEYTDMAFIQHAASGLVLVADDDRDSSTSVSVTTVPSMNAAQWMWNTTSFVMNAFRDSDRCLAANEDCTGLIVKACNADDKTQLFPTFFPDFNPITRQHNTVKMMCGGEEVCLALSQ